MATNWAGNHTYAAMSIERPGTLDELQALVARSPRIRALGSGHSFTDLADSDGVLVSLAALPVDVDLDEGSRTVTVGAGATYGRVAEELQSRGWALANLASLPHIGVAGAVATGTHGSGSANRSLAAAVSGLELVGADGSVRQAVRGDDGFDGSVVALGALGIVTRVTLDIEPTYQVRQDVFTGLRWSDLLEGFTELADAAYSVSFVTRFVGEEVGQVWVKSRDLEGPADLPGATVAATTLHMLAGGDLEALTPQLGVPGPWLDRLPHYRMAFTPSRGEELQSEYLVPRRAVVPALDAMRRLGANLASLLQSAEIRTVASEDLWLSSSYGTDVVGIHLTWVRDVPGVYAVLPRIEEALLPLGARPHWGKCFVARAHELAPLYPRWSDFARLRARTDPAGTFGNTFLARVLGD